MRDAFARALHNASKRRDDVFFLVADISPASSLDDFLAESPTRFIDVGVAEQSLIGIAAGIAMRGFRPFAYTIANFSIYRPFEQIRVDLCYQNLPVVVVGVGGGMAYSALGSTHHTIEDIAVMSALPNMTVVAPCDPLEVDEAVHASFGLEGPMYLRLGKAGEPDLTADAPEPFELGRIRKIREGYSVAILGYGPVLGLALDVANALDIGPEERIAVFSVHTMKPLDLKRLAEILNSFERVVTLEEHVEFGSLGSRVRQLAFEQSSDVDVQCLALHDRFIHVYGAQADLRNAHQITSEALVDAVKG